jgi:UDP-GlcNAc:undecaprenyl-phosphate GlcNAc-1-phosphate transferase
MAVTVVPILLSFGVVFVMIPALFRAAVHWQFVDLPGTRKIHTTPVPLLGGVAIYCGCSMAMVYSDGFTNRTLAIILGGAVLVAIGLFDDWYKSHGREFAVWPRVMVYICVSFIPLLFGIEISGITRWFEFGNSSVLLFDPWFSWLFTAVWIFGLMNMLNFMDGADGLAVGITAIAASTLLVVAMLKNQAGTVTLSAALLGACLAFWVYNYYPARMFMGDAGATFLGYTLAIITVDGAFKGTALISLLPPVLILGVPILDTSIVMLRRLVSGKELTKADKLHTHHTLMKWGLTQAQTVSFLYLIGIIFSLLSILVVVMIE